MTETVLETLDSSIVKTFLATLDFTMTRTASATQNHRAFSRRHNPSDQQCLIFHLADQRYGVDLFKVRAICSWTSIKAIPALPGVIPGMLNLNGSAVPLIDLRVRFGLASVYNKSTAVIVTRTPGLYGDRSMGVVVDSVSDVLRVPIGQIQPAPQLADSADAKLLNGLVNTEAGMVRLLDVDRLFSAKELLRLLVEFE